MTGLYIHANFKTKCDRLCGNISCLWKESPVLALRLNYTLWAFRRTVGLFFFVVVLKNK